MKYFHPLSPVVILPHLSNHAHGEFEAPRGNRLIGALAAVKGFKPFARYRLSGRGDCSRH
jgi:hypothetical protein